MKRLSVVLIACSGLALGAPFAYRVVGDGAPGNFASKVDQAFKAWQDVPGTTLKAARTDTTANNASFAWGADEVAINPDAASRTIISSRPGESASQSSEVRINPETTDLESALLVEAGLRLGLEISPLLGSEKRGIGEGEAKALKARYAQTGDLNNDGKITLEDLELLAANYGKRGNGIQGDLNGDGVVDDKDIEILKAAYSFEPLGTQTPVATPASPSSPGTPSTPSTPSTPTAPVPGTPPK